MTLPIDATPTADRVPATPSPTEATPTAVAAAAPIATPATALVATLGGHVTELAALADRLGATDALWITNDSPQTRDLLRDRNVEMVPYIDERDVRGVARAGPEARRLFRRHGIERVVSTGSAVALAYLPVAAAMGIESHYIESAARVDAPSVTGRLLSPLPRIRRWWQYEGAPARFRHLGGVYDPFVASPRPTTGPIRRVVVTVGTTVHDFGRLISTLVDAIPPDAEVLWQTGRSDVDGLGIDARPLVPEAELVAAIAEADVVVTHAGTGSLTMCLQGGKVPVFVPRRAHHGEHLDDHQVQLARWAGSAGLAITVEADAVRPHHLEAAAGLAVTTTPTERLILDDRP